MARKKYVEIEPYEYETSLGVNNLDLSNRTITIVPVINKKEGRYEVDLDEKEIEWLSKAIGEDVTPKWYPNKMHPVYDTKIGKVKLKMERIRLDLNDPYDYLAYKILKGSYLVAPSKDVIDNASDDRYLKAIFYFVNDHESAKKKYEDVHTRNKAISLITTASREKRLNLAILLGVVDFFEEDKDEEIFTSLTEIAEKHPEKILEYEDAKAMELSIRATVKVAMMRDVIVKKADYLYFDNEKLCKQEDMVKFFSDKKNAPYLKAITKRLLG